MISHTDRARTFCESWDLSPTKAYTDSLAAEFEALLQAQHDELNRWQMTAEEGGELLNEATIAIAGLAEERLIPCCGTCIGHFGPKGAELMNKGLKYARDNFATATRPKGEPDAHSTR